jgi:hypothetical protein
VAIAHGFVGANEGQDAVGGDQGGGTPAAQVQYQGGVAYRLPAKLRGFEVGAFEECLDLSVELFCECFHDRNIQNKFRLLRQLEKIVNFQFHRF